MIWLIGNFDQTSLQRKKVTIVHSSVLHMKGLTFLCNLFIVWKTICFTRNWNSGKWYQRKTVWKRIWKMRVLVGKSFSLFLLEITKKIELLIKNMFISNKFFNFFRFLSVCSAESFPWNWSVSRLTDFQTCSHRQKVVAR